MEIIGSRSLIVSVRVGVQNGLYFLMKLELIDAMPNKNGGIRSLLADIYLLIVSRP